jgi:hypothetical protein
MGFKADIQATRATQASTNAVVAQPIRLKGIQINTVDLILLLPTANTHAWVL